MAATTFGAISSLVGPSCCRATREIVVRTALRNSSIEGLHTRHFRRRSASFIPNEPWSTPEEEKVVTARAALYMRGGIGVRVNGASAATGDGVIANMEEVCERLVRYWDAECGEGRQAPEALAARQASVLVPLVSSSSAVTAGGTTTQDDGGGANNNNNNNNNNDNSGGGGGVHVLLCTRSAKLSSHAGEVCLPGGKNDPGEDDRTAALREAHEEVGLPPADAEVLAQLPPFLSKGHVSVRPVVARLRDDFSPTLNTDEVDNWFCCPLESFLSKDEGYSYRDWEFVDGKHIRVHFFQRGRHQVWGLTAVILIKTAEIAFGRPPEFDMKPPVPGGTDIQHIKSDGTEIERSLSTIERPELGSGSGPRGGGGRSTGAADLPTSRM